MSKDILEKVNKMVSSINEDKVKEKNRLEDDRNNLVLGVGKDIVNAIKPALDSIANSASSNYKEIRDMINGIKIEAPEINIPAFPKINIPTPQVKVNIPDIKIPDINMPEEMDIKGFIGIMGYDRGLLTNPLPVQLRDASGNPIDLLKNITSIVSGGGGKADYFTIKGFGASAFTGLQDPDGRLKVVLPSGAGGLTDIELRASSVPVEQVSGSVWSVAVIGAVASTAAALIDSSGEQYSGSNPLPVGGTVAVSGITNSVGATILDGEGLMKETWIVSDITASVKCSIVDSTGVGYSGSNPLPIAGTVLVSDITASVKTALIDSTGVQYSGSNPVPIAGAVSGTVIVSSITASTAVNIVDSTGVAYTGDNPVPVGGIVVVSGITASTQATIVDSTGVGYSGSNPLPTTKVYLATSTTTAVTVGADASTIIAPTSYERKSIIISHNSNFNLYIATGVATSLIGIPVVGNQIVGFDDYIGPISAIAQEASGTILVRYIEIAK